MEIEAYISSGILEGYVLHALSSQEMQEVECMSHIYPEIKVELSKIEMVYEQLAVSQSKLPPPAIKDAVMAVINSDVGSNPDETSIDSEAQKQFSDSEADKEVKAIAMKTTWMAVAASVLVIIGLSLVTLEMRSSNKELTKGLDDLKTTNQELLAKVDASKEVQENQESILSALAQNGTVSISLQGVEGKPKSSSVTVLWNQNNEQAFLAMGKLPEPPSDKQYQLWALVDGAPVDMGVFDIDKSDLQKMKTISGAQAFAITLEQKGGSPSPTLSEMYVIGNVPS